MGLDPFWVAFTLLMILGGTIAYGTIFILGRGNKPKTKK